MAKYVAGPMSLRRGVWVQEKSHRGTTSGHSTAAGLDSSTVPPPRPCSVSRLTVSNHHTSCCRGGRCSGKAVESVKARGLSNIPLG